MQVVRDLLSKRLAEVQTSIAPESRIGLDNIQVSVKHVIRDSKEVQAQHPDFDVYSQARVRAFMDGIAPLSLSDAKLEELARDTGLHKDAGLFGKARGKFTPVTPQEIERMRDIADVYGLVYGRDEPIDVHRLTAIRRLENITFSASGKLGHFGVSDLDVLARQTFNLPQDAFVTPQQRKDLIALVTLAKSAGKPLSASALADAYQPSTGKGTAVVTATTQSAVQVPDGLIAAPQSVEPETVYPSIEDRLRGFF